MSLKRGVVWWAVRIFVFTYNTLERHPMILATVMIVLALLCYGGYNELRS